MNRRGTRATLRSVKSRTALALGAGLTLTAVLAGCSAKAPADFEPPVSVADVPGSAVKAVTLLPSAEQRIGLATVPMQELSVTIGGLLTFRKVLPYSALVYDSDGSTWTFTRTQPHTYQRAAVKVAAIQGDSAVLTAGPAVGVQVVTVGAPELLGAEYNISGEE
jgi:hypothetical protein